VIEISAADLFLLQLLQPYIKVAAAKKRNILFFIN